jgi:hypothetical protein
MWGRSGVSVGALLLAGCGGGEPGPGAPSETLGPGDDPAAPIGAPGVPVQVTGPCQVSAVSAASLVELDKATFTTKLQDYAAGWLVPLNEALLGVDEATIVETMFESVRGTFDKACWYESTSYEFSPPPDLGTAETDSEFRQEIVDLLAEAVEVQTGTVLRLSVHECSGCSEPIGEQPSFINASLTTDGTLLLEVEFGPGQAWTRSITITPDEIAVRATLQPLSDWLDTSSASARDGTTVMPDLEGVVFAGARREAPSHIAGWFGISRLRVVSDPGGVHETVTQFHDDCVGAEVRLAPPDVGSSAGLDLGTFDVTTPGSTYCTTDTSCGPKERTGPFGHHGGGIFAVVEQPPSSSAEDVLVRVTTETETQLTVGGDAYAHGALGPTGQGGTVDVGATRQTDGYLVTFQPALDMGAALAMSQFSEEMQVTLPRWLNDEIFDLSFGGDPVPSVFVPRRELCPTEGVAPVVARREVEIVSGSGTLSVGGGRVLSASAGQCVGQSLEDVATYDLTSDYWDAGFVCQ